MNITRQARGDLDQAYDWIARDNPAAAARMIERLFQAMDQLEAREFGGPQVRIIGEQATRRWSVPPFWIYYRWVGDEILVVRVYHQARRPIGR